MLFHNTHLFGSASFLERLIDAVIYLILDPLGPISLPGFTNYTSYISHWQPLCHASSIQDMRGADPEGKLFEYIFQPAITGEGERGGRRENILGAENDATLFGNRKPPNK